MSSVGKLVSQWRQWINRNKTFTGHEMDELENHLLEEIDDLKQYEGLSEEEAFQKVVSVMGGREALDKEFVKVKPVWNKLKLRIRQNSLLIISILLILVVLLSSDLIFCSTHYVEIYKATEKNYLEMLPVSELKCLALVDSSNNEEIPSSILYTGKPEFLKNLMLTILFPNGVGYDLDSEKFHVKVKEYSLNPEKFWEANNDDKILSNPVYCCIAFISNIEYFIVIDDTNQIWFETKSKFNNSSFHTGIEIKKKDIRKAFSKKNQNLVSEKTKSEDWLMEPRRPRLFVYSSDDSLLMLDRFDHRDDKSYLELVQHKPDQELLIREKTYQNRIYQINLYKSLKQNHPILMWEEVEMVRKPVHIWNYMTYRKHINSRWY